MNTNEMMKTMKDFVNVLNYTSDNHEKWKEELSYYDRAICDLMHFIQLNNIEDTPTKEKNLILKQIKEYRTRRQEVKSKIDLGNRLYSKINKKNCNELSQKLNSLTELADVELIYSPRVLFDLFK